MLQQQNYKQLLRNQGEIESNIAADWGYTLHPKQYIPKPAHPKQNIKVANIEPMKRTVSIEPSQRLLKIQEEILLMQNQRKLNMLAKQAKGSTASQHKKLANVRPKASTFSQLLSELKEELPMVRNKKNAEEPEKGREGFSGQSEQQECMAIRQMKQFMEEYNFLLEHKHIIQKNSERARKVLGLKKTRVEELNQKIQSLKNQIPKVTLGKIIEINKEISELYREYQKHIIPSKEVSMERSTVYRSRRGTSLSRSKLKTSLLKQSFALLDTLKLSPDLKNKKRSSYDTSGYHQSPRNEQLVQLKDFVILQEMKESSDGQSVSIEPSKQGDSELMKEHRSVFLGKGSIKLTKNVSQHQRRNRLYTVTEKPTIREQKRERMNTTITDSFLSRDIIEKGKALDNRLRQHEDVLDVWRNRIDENKEKVTANYLRSLPKAKKFKKTLKATTQNNQSIQPDAHNERMAKAKAILAVRMDEVKSQMIQKERVFCQIIRKKQSKYKRVLGTQIMEMCDPQAQARSILANGLTSQENSKERQLLHGNEIRPTDQNTKYADQPEWMTVDPESEDIYWAMCRNEKMNLLLKHHKRK